MNVNVSRRSFRSLLRGPTLSPSLLSFKNFCKSGLPSAGAQTKVSAVLNQKINWLPSTIRLW